MVSGAAPLARQIGFNGASPPPMERFMRIKPPVSSEQAYQYLSLNAVLVWGIDDAAKMDPQLQAIAGAMAEVSALDIPDEVEPIFGEDHALDPEATA
jgi:hypothetical protein